MRYATAVFVAVLMSLPSFALAQDQPAEEAAKQQRFKGVELLRAADARISKAKSIVFQGASKGVGALATRSPRASGTVSMVRDGKAAPGFRFIARGTADWWGKETATRTFAASFDGKKFRSVREHEKLVMEAPWSTSTDLMDEGAGWIATWALQWKELITNCFNEPETILPNRVEGVSIVNGVECDIVYVDYSELANRSLFDVWWHIGKQDSLPRRIDMHLVGAGGDGFTITELDRIELDVAVSESDLTLAIPDGFKVEQAPEPEGRRGVAIVKAAGPAPSTAAPEWTAIDQTGEECSLSDYRGKVVLMDFWATWCPPCREVMPSLQKLHEKYKDDGLVVLGMNCWESGDPAAHMEKHGFTYGLILKADDAAKAYGVSAIPTLYVIGRDGKVVHRSVGSGGETALEDAIKAALAK